MTAPPSPLWSFGITQEFPRGDHAWAESVLDGIASIGATGLRLPVMLESSNRESAEWLDWLIPRVSATLELLPCLRRPNALRPAAAGCAAEFLTRYRRHFRSVEFLSARSPDAALRAHASGLVLACRADADDVEHLGEAGLLNGVRAIGLQIEAGIDVAEELPRIRDALRRYTDSAEIWLTDTGESLAGSKGEASSLSRFLELSACELDRLYWQGRQHDGAAGIVDRGGRLGLLGRLLKEGGKARVRQVTELARPGIARDTHPVLVVGGAGFIGCNLADSLLQDGYDVVVLDSLARPGVENNLAWLRERHPQRLSACLGDIRDTDAVAAAVKDAGAVFHLAAQVAVTTSLSDPLDDFSVNAEGTLKLLEAARLGQARTPVIFASTNKVYGNLDHMEMMTLGDCYFPVDGELRAHGIGEAANLDFCTPYGCSKGVADQYVLDYAKSFGLPTAVLRMSCIYGPRQFGTEDQGWVAHFLLRAMKGEPITIYGDGMQVRDILHVRDAVAAYRGLLHSIETVKGQAFNLGGGPANAVSLRMVLQEIEQVIGRKVPVSHSDWRTGDQSYFVSDTRKLEQKLGWRAHIGWREGIRDLAAWIGTLIQETHMQPGERERMRA